MDINAVIRDRKEKKRTAHLTMMVIPHSHGRAIKNIRIPMWLIRSFVITGICSFIVAGYFTANYFLLRDVIVENEELKVVNNAQAYQINELEGVAGTMEAKIEYLLRLDQEVREKVGLLNENNDETPQTQSLVSSRSGMGGVGDFIAMEFEEDFDNGEKSGVCLEPLEGEVDPLDELRDKLAEMDTMLTQQEEDIQLLTSDVDKRLTYLSALPDAWPVKGRLTSDFGWRKSPYSSKRSEFHEGIDIATAYGTAIRAAGDGVVTFSGYKGSWGRLIIISHGYGYVSQYAHNSANLVKVGDRVKKGEVIARMGNSGRSTGPHLHFGVAKNGTWIDPLPILRGEQQ